jgi:hypothetical protein
LKTVLIVEFLMCVALTVVFSQVIIKLGSLIEALADRTVLSLSGAFYIIAFLILVSLTLRFLRKTS